MHDRLLAAIGAPVTVVRLRKNLPTWILKACITSGLLYYIFRTIPVSEIVPAIVSARMDLFAVAFLLVLLMNHVSACRMKLLTDRQGMTVSRRRIFEINLITNFYGLALPGSLAGGGIRWNMLYKADRNGTGALVAIVFNRLVLTTATVATGLAFWVLAGSYRTNNAAGASLMGILALLLALQGAMIQGRIFPRVERFLEGGGRLPEFLRSKLGKLALSARQYRDLPRASLARIAALSFAEELLGVLSYCFVALAIGLDVPVIQLGWIRSCINIVLMLPVSLSGFGVREGALIALLEPFGVGGAAAVAFSLLLFARSLLTAAIGGVLEVAYLLFPAEWMSPKEK